MAPRKNFDHIPHGLARALDVMGEWWTPLVVHAIAAGHHRFEEIQAELGIARNILTDRLGTLFDRKVIEKVEYTQRPQRFEYHLSKAGAELVPILEMLEAWGNKWHGPGRPKGDDDDGTAGVPARV